MEQLKPSEIRERLLSIGIDDESTVISIMEFYFIREGRISLVDAVNAISKTIEGDRG